METWRYRYQFDSIRLASKDLDKTCVHCGCPIVKGQLYRVYCGKYIHLTCLVKRHPRKLPQIIHVLKEKYGIDIARGFLFMVKTFFEEKPHLMKYLVEAEKVLSS